MSAKVHTMHYAANLGLCRLHCRRCEEETLHRMAKCVHCGTVYEVAIPRNLYGAELREKMSVEHFKISQAAKRKHRRLSIAP